MALLTELARVSILDSRMCPARAQHTDQPSWKLGAKRSCAWKVPKQRKNTLCSGQNVCVLVKVFWSKCFGQSGVVKSVNFKPRQGAGGPLSVPL